ncbi:MAG: DUF6323 family protein [Eubacteriales bacterium]|jgi:hypothetical protein|nr:DUF6323 family protein [Eubacteriales bacterium]
MQQEKEAGLILVVREQFLAELRAANETSSRYGLKLSEQSMQALAQTRTRALLDHGRVELGASAVSALVEGFCDSPFLLQENYEATLAELLDAFYYFKNASGERVADDELIAAMRMRYDAYDGAVEGVTGTTLEALCLARRFGLAQDEDAWEDDDDDEADDE